jgi:hypothetical protein
VDRYAFLIVCPVILVLQLMVIVIYYQYSGLMQRSRNIFFGIAVFDLLINVHFLVTSGTPSPMQSTTRWRTQGRRCRRPSLFSVW